MRSVLKTDVVIIGGGISGISTAFWLIKRGIKNVVVVEKAYIGSGSTFKCATGIRASFTSEEHVVLMRESINLWKALSQELGFSYMRGGYVWLLSNEDQLKAFRELSRIHNSFGVPTRIISVEDVEKLVSKIDTRSILCALYDPLAGKADPFEALYSMAGFLRSAGVRILQQVEATRILQNGPQVVGVETTKGIIQGPIVVVAAGYETRGLVKTVDVDLPLKNVPHHAVITEAYKRAFDPLLVDAASGSYLVQTFHGGFIMGTEIKEREEAQPTPRVDFLYKVASVWIKYLPWLRNVNFLRYWVGYYVMSPDNHPIIGPLPEIDGLYVAAGFSGHGFMMGPIVGKILAEWIIDGKPSIPQAARLSYKRIEEGKLIHEKAVIG